MDERQQFLDHIASLPWDQSHEARLVFSDWLLEHDEPEEAERQRNHVAAERWLRVFADQCGETCVQGYDDGHWDSEAAEFVQHSPEVWEKITYEMVVDAGHEFVKHGEYLVQVGSENARDWFSVYQKVGDDWKYDKDASKKRIEDFWKNWQIVTGEKLPDSMYEKDEYGYIPIENHPFSCSC